MAGERCGQGKHKHTDGPFYDGEFKNNRQNGHGTYFYKNGSKYVGSWVDDVKCGDGIATFTYQNISKRECILGIMYYANGDVYNGAWANDKWNGHGVLKTSDGKQIEGDFVDNVHHNAEFTYSVEQGQNR